MKNAVHKLATLTALLLAACTPAAQRFDASFLTMGTQAVVSVWTADPATALSVSQRIEQQWQQQAVDWYAWSASGELQRLNAALARSESFTASPTLAQLLREAQQLHRASDGYFDPAIAPMTASWGFADPPSNGVPDDARLSAWRTHHATLADLRLQGNVISARRPDLQLDLGAIAKGYALDLAAQQLQAAHVSGTLNLGGQIRVSGQPPRAARQFQIRAPDKMAAALAEVTLKTGESLSTSGSYERMREINGVRIHHLLDPHTGAPVAHTLAVTVIAPNATLADAASTALMAAGPTHWRRIARQLGISEVLRMDATGKIEVTAALYARLRWRADTAAHRIQILAP